MADDQLNHRSRMTRQMKEDQGLAGRGSDLVERLLSKSLKRFDEKRRKQQTRMEETVQKFAMRLFDEESKVTEAAAEASADQGHHQGAGMPARRSEAETIIVAVDADVVRQLRAAAEESQTSVSSLVQSGMMEWLEGYERSKRRRQQLRPLP
jgi:hypothetical protein